MGGVQRPVAVVAGSANVIRCTRWPMCYIRSMSEVASRELRNHTRSVLDRVARGEEITVTVRGRPVAELTPVAAKPRWMARDRFLREIMSHQADPGLAADLESLADETTDDLPWL